MNYEELINSKTQLQYGNGLNEINTPAGLFDFQEYIVEKLAKKGRAACFLDTGLGKTIIELTLASNYVKTTNKPVLILTPLAVAHQFIKEAEKFGIDDVSYSKDGKIKSKIVLCNYERLDKFNPDDYDCAIADESSIIKNYEGATRILLTAFMRKIKYRYLATATPSPNDFVELGTSSDVLGYLGYMEMLTKYFSNKENNVVQTQDRIDGKWYLKPHAAENFFAWISSWSISMRKPSDLGFSDEKHILPRLNMNYRAVENIEMQEENGQTLMFNRVAQRLTEVRNEQKQTIENRCNLAVELAENHEYSVYWCNFNDEGDLLEKLDDNAVQIKGGMKLEKKEELLTAFSNGEIKKLITKPKITAFGLNWQHCNHTVFFPTFSYEQYYQAIRRFWRFGQKRDVTCEMIYSDGQKRVIDSLVEKARKADELFSKLNNNINQQYSSKAVKFDNKTEIPNFLRVG